jgi:hypothetical protein
MGRRELLVEGKDDQHVLWALLQAHAVPQTFSVLAIEGIERLLDQLPSRLKGSDLECLSVIVDADEDIANRWLQLKARLENAGCTGVPEHPARDGTVAQIPDGPRVGVWLMPDNHLPGMLESFLAFLVPEGDALLPLVDEFLTTKVVSPRRRFRDAHLPKARIHTWLAVQEEPAKPLGQAITARYLNAHRAVVTPFVNWIRAALVD